MLRGQHSIGQHVRDAACYVCWAFARAYSPEVMRPHIKELSAAMLLTALFDREINCRRAASAAFQENVGRQGNANFPLGIEIITVADYFSLGNRSQAYGVIAPQVAKMDPEILQSAVHHLHQTKLCHWDRDIRELASKSLASMVAIDPAVCLDVLSALVSEGTSPNLFKRHGAVLGISRMLLAYKRCEATLPAALVDGIVNLVPAIDKARMYRGRGGELLREASCMLIESLAKFSVPIPIKTQVLLVESLNENFRQPQDHIRVSTSKALRQFLFSYFPIKEAPSENLQRLTVLKYVSGLESEENVSITRGYASAIGALPPKLLCLPDGRLDTVLESLFCATAPGKKIAGEVDAETRRNCVESVIEITEKVCCFPQFQARHFERCLEILFRACSDYNIDKRGDTGSWSRMAALKGLERVWRTYFSLFSSYPQDPQSCTFSPLKPLGSSSQPLQVGCVVLTCFGHGTVRSVIDDGLEVAVQFPVRSLGEVMAEGLECVIPAANVSVISGPSSIESSPSLPPIIDRTLVEHHEVAASPLQPDLLPQEQVQYLVLETVKLVFKQLAEKLDAVRDVAGKVLESLVGGSDPCIGFVVDRQKIARCFGDTTTAIQNIETRKSNVPAILASMNNFHICF